MLTENKVFISPEGEHDYNKKYEQYSIVTHTQGDVITAYLAIKPVPPFISITDKNFWKFLKSDVGGSDISGKADKEVTPTVITPSVDGTIANLTAEEIESLRIGDIVKATTESNGTTRDWFVVRVKTTSPQQVAMIWANENGITTRVFTKNNGVWSSEQGASIGYADVARKVRIANTQPQTGMSTNTLYEFGVISQNTTFAINPAQEVGIANVWMWTFSTGDTAPTITWPAEITMWSSCDAPDIEANKYYEVSVMNGVGTIISADIPQTEVEP